jgi:protein gp37
MQLEGGLAPGGIMRGRPIVINEFPPRNVWLGVSVENQQWADIRIPALLETPAARRFLSCEPLLGPVDLSRFLHLRYIGANLTEAPLPPSAAEACGLPALHWVIVGGESGRGARPMQLDWARQLRDQSEAASIAFHFKQWGAHNPDGTLARSKHDTGRLLDGRTWDEFPEVAC